jgi:MFS family permease
VVGGLLVVLLTVFVGFGAVVPVLPPLVVEHLGGSQPAVGLTFALSGTAALLARPYAGRVAQRYGGRPVLAVGCLLAALVGAAYALPAGLPGLFATRVLMGVAEAVVFTAGSVWVVALAPTHRRAEIVGWYGLAMWGGWTLGPVVGEALLGTTGYRAVWLLAGLSPLVALAVVGTLPRPAPGPVGPAGRLLPRPVVLPGIALALSAFGYAALTGFVALHLAARGIAHGAAMLSLFGAAYVAVRLVAGRLPDRLGPRPVVVFCGLAEAAGLLLIAVAPTWPVAAVGALVMGGGFTLLYPALALSVIRRCPEEERGVALGAYTSFWDLGLGVAGLVTGVVALLGYPVVFVLAAALAGTAAVLGLTSAAVTGR